MTTTSISPATSRRLHELESRYAALEPRLADTPEKEALSVLLMRSMVGPTSFVDDELRPAVGVARYVWPHQRDIVWLVAMRVPEARATPTDIPAKLANGLSGWQTSETSE